MNKSARTVMIYCLDQDMRTTASLGIFNCTRRLLEAMTALPDPGFCCVILCSSTNREQIVPPVLPAWISCREVRGNYSSGLRRLFADHILAPLWAARLKAGAVHFPKGWIPILPLPRIPVIATLFDTIVSYYATKPSRHITASKAAYFLRMTRWTLEHADSVVTISNFSRDTLSSLVPAARNRISVIYPGPGLPARSATAGKRTAILVLGSKLHHKATAQTLHLLEKYMASRNVNLPVVVTGLDSWPADWPDKPTRISLQFAGRVSDDEMLNLIESSLALVFLSEIEGFGLPAIEAYRLGTPVCFRQAHALAEIMEGCPGGWDGKSDETFCEALDHVLRLDSATLKLLQDRIASRFNWKINAEKTLDAYRSLLK